MKNADIEKRLNPEDYCDKQWTQVQSYTDGIYDGSILVGKYIKLAAEKYVRMLNEKDKYVFRVEKVDKVFKFFSFINVELKNEYIQYPLLPWQSWILSFIYGFYYKDNPEKRVIREVFLFVGRKNGKTNFTSALQIYGMVGDGVENPQSLLLANTSAQASVSLNYAKDIITHSPPLRKRLVGQRSRIIYKDMNKQGFCQVFSSVDPARIEGTSPSLALIDEIHGWDNNGPYLAVKTGVGARVNPMIFIISTAGNKNAGFCNEYLNYHKNILEEKIKDDNSVAFIYQPDPEDDLSDEKIWAKSNPSLGIIISVDDLKIAYQQAAHSFADKYAFITKHLNIFYDTPDVWIPEDVLYDVFVKFDLSILKGRDCYMGIDLSRTTDLTSIVLVFPPTEEDKKFYCIPFFFMANRADNILRKNGRDLTEWIRRDFIIKHEAQVIELPKIYDKIVELSNEFNILSISYDRYNAPQLISQLQEYGLFCQNFEQNARRFNAPLKYLESLIYEKEIQIWNNPCMLWNFANVILYVDSNSNIKIMKNKQNDSVDGVVALGMALGGYLDGKYGQEITGLRTYMNNTQ